VGPVPAASFLGGTAASALGIPDAIKALKGQMTPEEGQDFFMQSLPNLIPEAKAAAGAGGALAALHLMPRALLPKLGEGVDRVAPFSSHVADTLFGHGETNGKSFDIANDQGQNVARMWTSQYNPKQIYVNYIASLDPASGEVAGTMPSWGSPNANPLGTKEMMSLLPEIKKQFPDAQSIGGWRVSGARAAAGKTGPAEVKLGGINDTINALKQVPK
jgi:hypothetical protein